MYALPFYGEVLARFGVEHKAGLHSVLTVAPLLGAGEAALWSLGHGGGTLPLQKQQPGNGAKGIHSHS